MDLKYMDVLSCNVPTLFSSLTNTKMCYTYLFPLITLIFCLVILLRNIQKPQNPDKQLRMMTKEKIHVPKFMLELYQSGRDREWNGSKPDIVRSLIPKHAEFIIGNEVIEDLTDNHLLIFDLPTASEEEQFISAELRILTLVEINSNALLGVERLLKLSIYNDSTQQFLHFKQLHIYHLNNTWLSFNLTQPVTESLRKSSKSLKIIITISAFLPYFQANHLKLSLLPIDDNIEHNYPILLLSYNSNLSVPKKRFKRSLEEDYEEETNHIWDEKRARKVKKIRNTCKRRPLYINFSEIQYDIWIVQPSGYEAYQCQGKCFYPVADHLNPTKHAIVQALLHSVSPGKVARSCCVPTILDAISILYVDSNGVLTYRYAYKDMVVLECGCR